MGKAIEMAIEILQATRDGDDLAPEHLSLVQSAVNGWLTATGEVAYGQLYEFVKKGYVKPWFHAIENLTINHVGYVYWRGHGVEHYNLSWAYSKEAKEAAQELARRCIALESQGIEVTTNTAIWNWLASLKAKKAGE